MSHRGGGVGFGRGASLPVFRDACGAAVRNDCDIAEAMSRQLMAHADFSRYTWANGLRHSQLPDPIPETSIGKPAAW